jgi:hypothetical protein
MIYLLTIKHNVFLNGHYFFNEGKIICVDDDPGDTVVFYEYLNNGDVFHGCDDIPYILPETLKEFYIDDVFVLDEIIETIKVEISINRLI